MFKKRISKSLTSEWVVYNSIEEITTTKRCTWMLILNVAIYRSEYFDNIKISWVVILMCNFKQTSACLEYYQNTM